MPLHAGGVLSDEERRLNMTVSSRLITEPMTDWVITFASTPHTLYPLLSLSDSVVIMSDKRKAMTAAVKGPKSESNLVGKLNEIARLCGEIGRGKEELSSYGTLLDGNHRLQIRLENKTDEVEAKTKEVADRDTTITTMKAERDKVSDQHKKEKETLAEQFNTEKEFLTRNFADQACRWKQTYDLNKEYKDEVDALTTRTTKAEADVRRLTTQLAKVDSEHQKATNGLRSAETELATLTKALQTKGLSLQLAQRKLEDAEAKLDMLKNEVGITTLNHKELYAQHVSPTMKPA